MTGKCVNLNCLILTGPQILTITVNLNPNMFLSICPTFFLPKINQRMYLQTK